MGGVNKALIEIDGRAIIERQLEVLRQITTDIAAAGGEPSELARFGVPVLADATPGAGPLAGIAAALAWSHEPYVLCVACDMPSLSVGVLSMLVSEATGDVDVVAPRVEGRAQPMCAVYSRRCLFVVERRLAAQDLRAVELLSDPALDVRWIEEEKIRNVDPSLLCFANVNTPRDLL